MATAESEPASRLFAADLIEYARRLKRPPLNNRKLNGKILNYHAASSVRSEIIKAKDKLSIFFEIVPLNVNHVVEQARQDSRDASIAGSLFQDALLTYVRATHTKSNHRNKTPVEERLPKGLESAHKRLVSIREDAIAHHGRAEGSVRRPWTLDCAIAEFYSDGTCSFSYHIETANWMASAVADLAETIPAALEVAETLVRERVDELNDAISETLDDERYADLLLECNYDPTSVYSSITTQAAYSAGKLSSPSTTAQYDETEGERLIRYVENWPTLKKRYEEAQALETHPEPSGD
jgi:hypothetical protein